MIDNELLDSAEEVRGFGYWASRDFLKHQTSESVANAQIVIVPHENYGGQAYPLFAVGTTELFRYLRDEAPAGVDIEIACEDDEYREIALHSELVRLGVILTKYAVAPILVGLITKFLETKLGRLFSKAEVEASLLIEGGPVDHPHVVKLDYKGPASTFEKALRADVLRLNAAPQKAKPKQLDGE